jgi:CDP-diacylglycerol pyrophosphatase
VQHSRLSPVGALLVVLAILCGCATAPSYPPLPPAPVHPNGQVLWGIVHGKCVPDQTDHASPAPCALVSLDGGEAHGFAVLKDRSGVAQHLVMPTAQIPGIEDPRVRGPGATNYFAQAWNARRFTDARLGAPLPREQMSVAVNSIYGRSQDLLHLHVDCLDAGVLSALRADAPRIGRGWSRVTLAGHHYLARRLEGDTLAANPFDLLAGGVPSAAKEMGGWTLVLVGATFDGRPGFYLLADRANPAAGDYGSGEELQDHECKGHAAAG